VRVAAIDVGTNSVHLLVADIEPDGTRTLVEKARSQVMLGSGGLSERRIADDAFERGLQAMRDFRAAIDSLDVDDVHAGATSAVREAANGAEFCRAVKAETGIHIRVISGLDEARLIYLGARESLDFSNGRMMLCDIGGGSTEFIVCDAQGLSHSWSLPLGHIRLADAFPGEALTPDLRDALKHHIRSVLRPVRTRVPKGHVHALVGTSGTMRCLARIATAMRGEPTPEHGHGLVLYRKDVEQMLEQFATMTEAERARMPGMDPKRVRTLPAGAVVVREVMKATGLHALTTSEQSLRDGLMVDWIERNRPEIDLSALVRDPRKRSVLYAMQRFSVDEAHADQVARISSAIFEATAELHELPIGDAELLEHASRLHDIGHHIAGKGHHRHGQYLLKHIRMLGFTAPEIAVLANVVRYHSRSKPKSTHSDYRSLSSIDQRRVRVLAGVLKIADGLDRSHNQPIAEVSVDVQPDRITVRAHTPGPAELEGWAASQRTGLLSDTLGRPVDVEIVTP
jgi:exopolyphosphatase/guanosine-5'-triphosphate,3'-diphosphate pyrophosphatase